MTSKPILLDLEILVAARRVCLLLQNLTSLPQGISLFVDQDAAVPVSWPSSLTLLKSNGPKFWSEALELQFAVPFLRADMFAVPARRDSLFKFSSR